MSHQDLQNPYFYQPYHVENPFSTINSTYRQMGSTYMDDSSSFLLPGYVDHHDDTISSAFGFNNYILMNEEKHQEIIQVCASENDQVITSNNSTIMEATGDEDSNTCNDMKKDKQAKGSQKDEEETPKKESNKAKKKVEKKEKQSRFAFMTKSEIDNLEDGYRWRKYGQKAVKNSPYPRSYYRCTTQKCVVKKRVERSLQDPSIVITTYEGTHNHHVPSNLRGNINVASLLHHPSPLSVSSSSFLPELFVQMQQQVYGHGGGVSTSSGSGSNGTMYQQQTPFHQHMQFPDCGLLQDIVPSSIFLKQEH